MSIFWNGSAINTLMWNGVETTGVYNGNIVWGNNSQQAKTLTLYHSEGGSLTADTLTGYPGDSVNLTTAYNTYWRFSGYDVTGDGTLNGNTYTFGNTDTTICACYKVNAFTASGGFEKGSNVTVTANGVGSNNYSNISTKYAIQSYHTNNVPSNWYSNSNRWNPSNASAYNITLNPKMSVTGYHGSTTRGDGYGFTAVSLIGNTTTQSQSWYVTGSTTQSTMSYNKTFTTTTQSTYGISGQIRAAGARAVQATATYIATATTGTWTATGYAP